MDRVSQNMNVSLFDIDTSLVANMQFQNVQIRETEHFFNTFTNFQNQVGSFIPQTSDISPLVNNFISIFNISGPFN